MITLIIPLQQLLSIIFTVVWCEIFYFFCKSVSVAKTLFKMSGLKEYLKQETQFYMLRLDHPKASDFYLSAWQTTRSPVPILIWRTLLFLTSISIVISSMTFYIINGKIGYWFIYLTHWGLTINTLTTGLAVFISARCYFTGPINAEFKLPWYVKVYWVVYNISVPLAFLITIFYWTLLYEAGIEEELNHSLDIAIHGINSLVMFLLLASTAQPSRILHFYQPLQFAFIYVVFGVIYFLAGGVEQEGNPWIYPVVNWANPGPTIGVVAITGFLLMVLHLLVVGLSKARNAVAEKFVKVSLGIRAEEVPLRQRAPTTT